MPFPAVIILTTFITLTGIFGFYKIFLDKPQTQTVVNTAPLVSEKIPQSLPSSQPQTSTNPLPSTKSNSPTPRLSPRPSALIGSITVLQNNLTSPSTLSGNSIISGLIDISGTPPSGSSIVIVARKYGSSDPFKTVVDGIKPQDSENWSWNSTQSGTSYDVMAVLKGKSGIVDVDYAKSQTYTIKSPAYQQIIAVDVGYLLAAPSGTITISCNTHLGNNTWTAVVNYPQVSGAQYYLLQVGSTSGASDIANYQTNGYTQGVTLNDSVGYFAQYAVSSVSNPTAYQYSPLSTPTQIKCP